jgi:hypothetical protein
MKKIRNPGRTPQCVGCCLPNGNNTLLLNIPSFESVDRKFGTSEITSPQAVTLYMIHELNGSGVRPCLMDVFHIYVYIGVMFSVILESFLQKEIRVSPPSKVIHKLLYDCSTNMIVRPIVPPCLCRSNETPQGCSDS